MITQLTTQTKIRIARMLSKSVLTLRGLCGADAKVSCQRKGLSWNLDLTEGIDLSIYLFGQFEPEVARACQYLIRPGAIVLDIGANIGAHALPMARLCGHAGAVHAFEPTEYAVQKLRDNLMLNPGLKDQLLIHHTLLNDGRSEARPSAIASSWQLSDQPDAEKHPLHGGSFKALGACGVTSLDRFVEEQALTRIDLIKLDVDGNEWSVLQGATQTLLRHRPPIVMEFALDYETSAFSNILELLNRSGYTATSLTQQKTLPLQLDSLRRLIPQNGSINVLLRPDSAT